MKTCIVVLALVVACMTVGGVAEETHPSSDRKDKKGGPSWWWDLSYRPVVVVRGSLQETSKAKPDLSIQGAYDAWSKLTAPSLANQPTEKGFYLLLTRLKVEEVLYVDKTLLHSNAKINGLLEGKRKEVDCLLPAGLKQVGEPDEEGRYVFTYDLNLPGGEYVLPKVLPGKEFVLIFEYSSLYPLEGLYLTSAAAVEDLDEVRRMCEDRRKP